MEELTVEFLEKYPHNKIFARGETIDSPAGLNMTASGKMLRWVAVRGIIADWAIYCEWATRDWNYVGSYGNKVYGERNIRKLVPCTDETFKRYRY